MLELTTSERDHVHFGKKINAIKEYRERTGKDLKQAKDAVCAYEKEWLAWKKENEAAGAPSLDPYKTPAVLQDVRVAQERYDALLDSFHALEQRAVVAEKGLEAERALCRLLVAKLDLVLTEWERLARTYKEGSGSADLVRTLSHEINQTISPTRRYLDTKY